MALDWSPFVAFVGRHQRFLVTTHVRPDGDALGSQLAMCVALEAIGKTCRPMVASPVPDRYRFMDTSAKIELFQPPGETFLDCDAIVVVDTGTWNQLGRAADLVRRSTAEKFVIDHHQTQDELGGGRLVDTSAEACGRLVREAVGALGVSLTPTIASHLFIALATDTGWFRHANVSPASFALAAELMAAGADPVGSFERIFESHTLARLRLIGRALERLSVAADGRVALTEVYLADYAATGAVPLDTEDLINFPRSLQQAEVALLFIEQPEGGIKVSFRSRTDATDVAKLAERFGGGGHRRAAGATVAGGIDDVKSKVLAAAEAMLCGATS